MQLLAACLLLLLHLLARARVGSKQAADAAGIVPVNFATCVSKNWHVRDVSRSLSRDSFLVGKTLMPKTKQNKTKQRD